MSQRQASAAAGFGQSYLAQVESGRKPISLASLKALEQVYGVKLERYYGGVGVRGRPGHWAATKQAMASLKRPGWSTRITQIPRTPKYQHPQTVRRSHDPLWPIGVHLGEGARRQVEQLELMRKADERFWRMFNSLRFDSWTEKWFLVCLALLGAQMVRLRLDRLGCSLNTIDGITGKTGQLIQGFVLKGQSASLVWCPQVAIRLKNGEICVDNLLIISDGEKTLTLVVEVDGAPYHQDLGKEAWRDQELGVPVFHLDAGEVGHPGAIRKILCWAHQQLRAA